MPNQPYIRVKDQKVYPVSSIQISIKRGKVIRIFVEDLDHACPEEIKNRDAFPKIKMDIEADQGDETAGKSKNKENVYCPVPYCTPEQIKERLCDFKLFVSWLGSEKNHKKLISNSERFMVYKTYNLEDLFKEVLNIAKPDEAKLKDSPPSKSVADQLKDLEDEVKKRITQTIPVEFEKPATPVKHLSEI